MEDCQKNKRGSESDSEFSGNSMEDEGDRRKMRKISRKNKMEAGGSPLSLRIEMESEEEDVFYPFVADDKENYQFLSNQENGQIGLRSFEKKMKNPKIKRNLFEKKKSESQTGRKNDFANADLAIGEARGVLESMRFKEKNQEESLSLPDFLSFFEKLDIIRMPKDPNSQQMTAFLMLNALETHFNSIPEGDEKILLLLSMKIAKNSSIKALASSEIVHFLNRKKPLEAKEWVLQNIKGSFNAFLSDFSQVNNGFLENLQFIFEKECVTCFSQKMLEFQNMVRESNAQYIQSISHEATTLREALQQMSVEFQNYQNSFNAESFKKKEEELLMILNKSKEQEKKNSMLSEQMKRLGDNWRLLNRKLDRTREKKTRLKWKEEDLQESLQDYTEKLMRLDYEDYDLKRKKLGDFFQEKQSKMMETWDGIAQRMVELSEEKEAVLRIKEENMEIQAKLREKQISFKNLRCSNCGESDFSFETKERMEEKAMLGRSSSQDAKAKGSCWKTGVSFLWARGDRGMKKKGKKTQSFMEEVQRESAAVWVFLVIVFLLALAETGRIAVFLAEEEAL